MTEEIWGSWIEHDGKGCPLPIGTIAERRYRGGTSFIGPVGTLWDRRSHTTVWHATHFRYKRNRWIWGSVDPELEITRYRVRQFRAMEQLRRLAEEPEKVPA